MILITGASGFLGAHFVKHLSESGLPVRALYHLHPPEEAMLAWRGVSWMQADLLDIYDVAAAMEGITNIYHCAAIVSFNPKRKQELIHTNTEIAANVVNAALDAGVRKLIHISSVAALGRNGTAREINEEAQWEESRLNSAYGLSKYAAELELWRGVGEGLQACILNPGIILGEPLQAAGWDDGSPKLMQTAYSEFPFYTDGVTAFVDVEDVVTAAVALMNSEISAERFILSAGNFPFREIFNRMADALGRKQPRIHAGNFATDLVWRCYAIKEMLTGKSPLITKETAINARTKSFYQADKIIETLPGFAYTPLEQTIKKMANAFLAAHRP